MPDAHSFTLLARSTRHCAYRITCTCLCTRDAECRLPPCRAAILLALGESPAVVNVHTHFRAGNNLPEIEVVP